MASRGISGFIKSGLGIIRELPRIFDEEQELRKQGKPEKYSIDVISMGKVGDEAINELASRGDEQLSVYLHRIRGFHRVTDLVDPDFNIVKSRKDEFINFQKQNLEGIVDVEVIGYRRLQDLKRHEVAKREEQPDPEKKKLNPLSRIILLTQRFSFDRLDISDEAFERAVAAGNAQEANRILYSRANYEASFPEMDYISRMDRDYPKKLAELQARICDEASRLEDRLSRINIDMRGETPKTIADQIIGSREFGRWLKTNDYMGFIFCVSNPVDLFSYIICKYSGLPSSKVLGVSAHDETRLARRLRQVAKSQFTFDSFGDKKSRYKINDCRVKVLGQHNKYQSGISSTLAISGEDLVKGESFEWEYPNIPDFIMQGWKDAFNFVTREYIENVKQLPNKTAPETVQAFVSYIKAIMESDWENGSLRASCKAIHRDKGAERLIYDGNHVYLTFKGAYASKTNWLEKATKEEKEKIFMGRKGLLEIIDCAIREGLIEELTQDEDAERERVFEKRLSEILETRKVVERIVVKEKEPESRIYIISGRKIRWGDAENFVSPMNEVTHTIGRKGPATTPTSIEVWRHKAKNYLITGHKAGINYYSDRLEFLKGMYFADTEVPAGQFNSLLIDGETLYASHFQKGVSELYRYAGLYRGGFMGKLERILKMPTGYLGMIAGQLLFTMGKGLYRHREKSEPELVFDLRRKINALCCSEEFAALGGDGGFFCILDKELAPYKDDYRFFRPHEDISSLRIIRHKDEPILLIGTFEGTLGSYSIEKEEFGCRIKMGLHERSEQVYGIREAPSGNELLISTGNRTRRIGMEELLCQDSMKAIGNSNVYCPSDRSIFSSLIIRGG